MTRTGAMTHVCQEIWLNLTVLRARESAPDLVRGLIGLTDDMIDELERLNLEGVDRVGDEWKARLSRLFSALPFRYTPRLRARPSPTEILDILFDLQAPLLDLKQRQIEWTARHARFWLTRARGAS